MQGPEEHARGFRHRVRDDRALGQLQIQRGANHIVGHVEKAGRQRPELLGRQPAVALVHHLGQCIADIGAHPDHRRLRDAQLHRDLIGCLEPDAANVARKTVRVLRHDFDRVGPVGPEDPHRPCRAHAMAVQEHHDLANDLLLGPGVGDPPGPDPTDTAHLAQPFGLCLDDVEHLFAKRPDQLAGVDRTDAPDHARPQILLDALDRRRRGAPQEARLELLAVGAVVDPLSGCRDPFPGRDHGGVAHDRDQVAMAPCLDPQNAEPAVRVVEGDALDQPGQDLPVR